MRRGVVAAGLSVLAHVALGGGAVWLMREAPAPAGRVRVEAVGFAVETVAAGGEPAPAAPAEPVGEPAPAAAVPRARRHREVAKTVVPAVNHTETGEEQQATGNRQQATGNGGEGEGSGEEERATGNGQRATGNGGEGQRGNVGPDGESIRRLIERVVGYPRVARRQGIEGRVVVRFRIDEMGRPQEVSVVESAGGILDDAAREAVVRAAPYPNTPGWVRVPVDFSLRRAR